MKHLICIKIDVNGRNTRKIGNMHLCFEYLASIVFDCCDNLEIFHCIANGNSAPVFFKLNPPHQSHYSVFDLSSDTFMEI